MAKEGYVDARGVKEKKKKEFLFPLSRAWNSEMETITVAVEGGNTLSALPGQSMSECRLGGFGTSVVLVVCTGLMR